MFIVFHFIGLPVNVKCSHTGQYVQNGFYCMSKNRLDVLADEVATS